MRKGMLLDTENKPTEENGVWKINKVWHFQYNFFDKTYIYINQTVNGASNGLLS